MPQLNTFKLANPANYLIGITMVANLIDHTTLDWNHQLMKHLFPHQQATTILTILMASLSTSNSLVCIMLVMANIIYILVIDF